MRKKAEAPPTDELSFLPPYFEQTKFLLLAEKFLSRNGHRNVVPIDSSKHFRRTKKGKGKKAA